MARFQFFGTLVLAVMLSACGGSGGDASSPSPTQKPSSVNIKPTPPFAMKLQAPEVISESQEYTVSLAFEHASGGVSTQAEIVQSDLPAESVTVRVTDSGTVTLEVSELLQDGEIVVSIVAEDSSGQMQSEQVTLSVANTSAAAALEKADVLSAAIKNVLLADELIRLAEVLADLNYFSGSMSAEERQAVVSELETMVDEQGAQQMSEQFAALQLRTQYESRQLTEAEVNHHLSVFLTEIAGVLLPFHTTITALADSAQLFTDTFRLDSVFVDVDQNRVSSLWGNPALGEFHQGAWQFHAQMQFIASLINGSDAPLCSSTS